MTQPKVRATCSPAPSRSSFATAASAATQSAPGFIETPHGAREVAGLTALGVDVSDAAIKAAQGRMGRPEDIARAALYLASDDAEFVKRLKRLGVRYRPSCVATENITATARRSRVQRRNQVAVTWAMAHGVPTFPVSRANIRELLGSPSNHYEVAVAIARWVPELEQHVPRRRRPWESVDERTYLFAAVALAAVAMNEFVVEA